MTAVQANWTKDRERVRVYSSVTVLARRKARGLWYWRIVSDNGDGPWSIGYDTVNHALEAARVSIEDTRCEKIEPT